MDEFWKNPFTKLEAGRNAGLLLFSRLAPGAGTVIGGAGWSSPVARQAHNLKVVGSNPTPATNNPLNLMIYFPSGSFWKHVRVRLVSV